MSFFQPVPPLPQPTGPYGTSWAPPAWDRPSEGIAPAVVPVHAVLGRDDQAALLLQSIDVYPNGLVLELRIMRNPRQELEELHHHVFMRPDLWPRIGVEFADGRRAGDAAAMFTPGGPARDDDGFPTDPVLTQRGGGGGSTDYRMDFWLYPLPPDGPMTIYATWPAIGLEETKVEVDGAAIRRASREAIVIWD